MIDWLIDLPQNIASASLATISAVGRAGRKSSRFVRDTFRAHYNLLGQYTAPFEQEVLDIEQPPKPSSLNILGQIALFPVVILAWLASVTIAPLVYNSVFQLVSRFFRTANIAYLDLPKNEQIPPVKGVKPWYRKLFGLPGYLLGTVLGLVGAAAIALVRTIVNSFKSLVHSFASMTNFALDKEDSIEQFGLDKELRSNFMKYGFGLPGVIIGGFLGSFGFAAVGLSRVVLNSVKTAIALTISGINAARHANELFSGDIETDQRSKFRKYVLGFPGLIIGSFTAALGLGISALQRTVIESWKTTKRVYARIVKQAEEVQEELSDAADAEPEEKRHWADEYIFGVPGYLTGALSGVVGFAAVIAGRVLRASIVSATYSFAALTNLVLHEDNAINLQKDDRKPGIKYGFGFPGLVLGGIAGAIASAAIGLGRVMTNSYDTAKGLTLAAINVVRHDNEQLNIDSDDRKPLLKYGLGFPGLILGSLSAVLGIGFASVQRSAIESWKTSKHLFNKIVEQALEDPIPRVQAVDSDEVVPARSNIDFYLFGAPGLLLGSLAGSLGFATVSAGRIFKESAASTVHGFATVTNLALDPEDEIKSLGLEKQKDTRANKLKYGFGLPGVILGGLAGSLGFLTVGVGRVFTNSYKTAASLTVNGLNVARDKNEPEIRAGIEHDQRSRFRIYALGFPGLIVGSFTASIAIVLKSLGRVTKESEKTAKEVFNAFIQQAMPAIAYSAESQVTEERSPWNRYGFGAPGLLIGAVAGSVGFAAVIAARSFTQSVRSGHRTFLAAINFALDAEDSVVGAGLGVGFADDSRPGSEKYGLGLPGLVLGGIAGAMGFVAVGLGRVVVNSYYTAKGLTVSGINVARHANEQLSEDFEADKRSKLRKYALGFPGLIIGSFTAALGLGLSGLQRTMVESWKTTKQVFSNIVKHALPAEEPDDSAFSQEETVAEQPWKWADLFGVPGYLTGAVSGVLGFAAVIAGRVVIESFRSSGRSFVAVINLALHKDNEFQVREDKRAPHITFGLGFPGLVLGGIVGTVSAVGVTLVRIVTNSYATAKALTVSAINAVRHDDEQLEATNIKNDGRSRALKYILGFPGLIIGSLTGAIGFGYAIIERAVIETWKTTKEIYSKIAGVPEQREISESADVEPEVGERTFVDRYVFGFPGLILGALGGAAVVTARGLHSLFKDSFDTGSRTFASIANLGLEDHERFSFAELGQDDKRSWQAKYLLGAPGVIIGGVLGVLTLAGIGADKLTVQSFQSWRSLSGSLMNGSLEVPYFGGLAADKRSAKEKFTGILGYGLALVTTLPLSALVFSFRKIIPVTLGLILGLISSPFVAIGKGFSQLFLKTHRFAESAPAEDLVDSEHSVLERDKAKPHTEQRLKNLYSSLNGWGQFAANEDIKPGQDGRKGPWAFIRKVFTFNTSSRTESFLDEVLEASRRDPDFLNSASYQATIDKVKKHYNSLSRIESNHHVAIRDKQIDDIAEFVKNYIQGDGTSVPANIYSHPKQSWSATFWGVESTARRHEDEEANYDSNPVVEL